MRALGEQRYGTRYARGDPVAQKDSKQNANSAGNHAGRPDPPDQRGQLSSGASHKENAEQLRFTSRERNRLDGLRAFPGVNGFR